MKKFISKIVARLILFLVVLAVVWFFQYGHKYNPFAAKPAAQEQQQEVNLMGQVLSEDIKVTNATGEKVSLLSTLDKEKLTLVTMWATWCESCSVYYPVLEEIAKDAKYADKISFVMINMTSTEEVDNPVAHAQQYVTKNSYALPVYFDETGEIIDALALTEIPVGYVFDADGKMLDGIDGSSDDAEKIKEILDAIIQDFAK